ncbi:high frequency lysogenization protein HflD [Acrasis kona]|uniref:High frequency lysogenization protein HflD n=1 Tax=Acrasis kona TaxID=1008807 RepID=A0AAW2YJ96_9EUKA
MLLIVTAYFLYKVSHKCFNKGKGFEEIDQNESTTVEMGSSEAQFCLGLVWGMCVTNGRMPISAFLSWYFLNLVVIAAIMVAFPFIMMQFDH